MVGAKKPTLAALLLRPFARVLRTRPGLPSDLIDEFEGAHAVDGRIPLGAAIDLMQRAVSLTGDPDIGLRAALFTQLGDFEVLEWVAASAATWREATETVCRYVRVLSDGAAYQLEEVGGESHLMLGASIALPRVVADYQLAAYHMALQLRFPGGPPELAIWIEHAAPADVSSYRAVFPHAKQIVFSAPFNGFVSDAAHLDTPLPTANPALHRVLRAHADHLLAQSPRGDDLVERVNADIMDALRHGKATAVRTATRLGMSRRTLTRRLALLDTSYSSLLQEARYRSAVRFLCDTEHTVEDIAFLLGFSECAPFVRAFRRWSGSAPLEYRRRHRRAIAGP